MQLPQGVCVQVCVCVRAGVCVGIHREMLRTKHLPTEQIYEPAGVCLGGCFTVNSTRAHTHIHTELPNTVAIVCLCVVNSPLLVSRSYFIGHAHRDITEI